MSGDAWVRLVNSNGSDEHLALCSEALLEVQGRHEERLRKQYVVLPVTGRFLVQDGKAYRVQDQWIEGRARTRTRLGVVIYKAKVEIR